MASEYFPLQVYNKGYEPIIIRWFKQNGQNSTDNVLSNNHVTIESAFMGMEIFAAKDSAPHRVFSRIVLDQPAGSVHFTNTGSGLGQGPAFQPRPVQPTPVAPAKVSATGGFGGKAESSSMAGQGASTSEILLGGQEMHDAEVMDDYNLDESATNPTEPAKKAEPQWVPELGMFVDNVPEKAMQNILRQREAQMQQQFYLEEQMRQQELAGASTDTRSGKLDRIKAKLKGKNTWIIMIALAVALLLFFWRSGRNSNGPRV